MVRIALRVRAFLFLWHFLVCFSIMRCVLPELASVNGMSSGMGACNSKRTPFRAGTAGAFRVAACDVTQTPPAPAGGGAERSRRRANGAKKAGSGGAVEGECRRWEAERCAQARSFCRKAPRFSSFHGDFCDKVRTFFLSIALFRAINCADVPIKRGRKRTRKRENVHSRRQKLVVSPFSCKFAAEVPAPHSHFSFACGGLQSTP